MERLCVLVALFIIVQLCNGEDKYCYMKDDNRYMYFGSKTNYNLVRGKEMPTPPDCTPTYIWALIRHGNRFMTGSAHWSVQNMKTLRDQVIENHEKYNRGELCPEDLELLKKWTFKGKDNVQGDLTEQGKHDLSALAKRLKNTFKNLLESPDAKLIFQTSSKSRCINSSLAFTNGLLGTSYENLEDNKIVINDDLLRIMRKYPRVVEKRAKEFETSKYMRQVIAKISKRLGFEKSLTIEAVLEIDSFCAFETSWDINSRAAFCVAFTPEDMKVLEFMRDLKAYYTLGYGRPGAFSASCIIVSDMIDKLMDAASSNTSNAGAFYFTHSETVVPLLLHLGLYSGDEPLSKDTFEKQLHNRNWRISVFDPFNANFIAVLYKCKRESKLVFYQNEIIIEYPNCEKGVCPLEVLEILSEKLTPDRCDTKPYEISNNAKNNLEEDIVINGEIIEEEPHDEPNNKETSPTNNKPSDSNKNDKASKETGNNIIETKEGTSSSGDGIFNVRCSGIYSLINGFLSLLAALFLHAL